MENFVFKNETKVIFGKDTENSVGAECSRYGSKILLHYGGGSIKRSGLYDRVKLSLEASGLDVIELGGVKPNPRLSLVKEGIEICKKHNIDMILAVGGGSVIDSGKAIGIGVYHSGDVWDFYDGKATAEKMLPVGVILTIPAAGSETSISSVITKEDEKLKRGCGADCMRPEFAIMNPELTFSLPDYQTACGISDMLAHIMERYFTPSKNTDLSDRLCEAAMKSVINNAYALLKEPNNYDTRAEIMWNGTIAHSDLIGMGRVGDWASHGMEHEISALTDIAHGAGLSIIFPAWMKYVYSENPKRFLQFSTRVFNIEENFEDQSETVLRGIEALENFYKMLNLPIRFSDVDFDIEKIEDMADKFTHDDTVVQGNFKKLTKSDVIAIYNLAK